MTDFLATLVSRGQGRAIGPALTPRLVPEIVDVGLLRPARPAADLVDGDATLQPAAPAPAPGEVVVAAPSTVGEASLPPPPERNAVPEADVTVGRIPPASAPRVAQVAAARAPVPHDVSAEGTTIRRPSLLEPRQPPPAKPRPVAAEQPAARAGTTDSTARVPGDDPVGRPAAPQTPRKTELQTRERVAAIVPTRAAQAVPRVEVRIGRVEVRAPRPPEPVRYVEAAPTRSATTQNPFADLAAARRFVDRTWR